MRLAFALFKYFPFGGLQRDCLAIARECMRRNHQVRLYVLRVEGELPGDLEWEKLPVGGYRNHVRYRNFADRLSALKRQGAFDFLLGFNKMPGLDLYYAADSCYAERTSGRSRLYRGGSRYRQLSQAEQAVFAPGQHTDILLLDPTAAAEYGKHYRTPPERLHLLPPGIAADRKPGADRLTQRRSLRQEFAIADHELLLLMIGSGFRTKGLDRALRGIASLPAQLRQTLRFIVIGNDKAGPYLALANRLGIRDRLVLLQGRDDIPRFLQGADLLIHPAYKENTGMVILEAVVAGLPVLTTDTCGYARHVLAARAGRVLPSPFKQAELNIMLAAMLVSPQRSEWSRNGFDYGVRQDLFRPYEKAVDLIETILHDKEQNHAVFA